MQLPFAKDHPVQLALREMQMFATNPRFWAGLVAVAVVLAIVAPYGTREQLGFAGRLGYWGLVCAGTFLPACFFSVATGIALKRRGVPELLSWILGGIAATPAVFAVVYLLNVTLMDFPMDRHHSSPAALLLECMVIAIAVVLLNYLVGTRAQPTPAAAAEPTDEQPTATAIQQRLPLAKRGPVTRMTMQDHYVEVTTAKGSELLLLRMADAVAEADPAGIRIHRSHWVHPDHVTGTLRRDGRLLLMMDDGTELPVSRSRMTTVRDAGLL